MIQVYTGDGKGKTTAALGLALRASGAGLKVYIGQFIKGSSYSELKALKKIPNIKIEQYGSGCFIKDKPKQADIDLVRKGLKRVSQILVKRNYDLIILDEINVALYLGLLKVSEVTNLIKAAPKKTEIILTGRWAHPKVIRLANLVSEIKDVKHYYKKGIKARKGIEF
ncbi:MAG: cob(I)yrinic acid a,c-diamide adenosyltransferase [Omnitrophica WOR_2 bacterium SM23_29]|nr:MAG: cob(I)yrinic acid a,c-diamide adenosyltransferase [Omnitrophica WOR_2 bacterium SM23_29]